MTGTVEAPKSARRKSSDTLPLFDIIQKTLMGPGTARTSSTCRYFIINELHLLRNWPVRDDGDRFGRKPDHVDCRPDISRHKRLGVSVSARALLPWVASVVLRRKSLDGASNRSFRLVCSRLTLFPLLAFLGGIDTPHLVI